MNTSSQLLSLPRELREEVLSYLALPAYVYTSSSTPSTHHFNRLKKPEKTYVDTRIYLPYHFPPNILATCRQLRHECLEYHALRLNRVSTAMTPAVAEDPPLSWVLAARLGNEIEEASERNHDNGTLRITIEIQRAQRNSMGYAVPVREELSTRFLALLSHMDRARKLKIAIWPGYEWWNGGPQPFTDKLGNLRALAVQVSKQNSASIAIDKILEHLSLVEELYVDVLMLATDGARWDLPDKKWENILPWLNVPITTRGRALHKVTRRLVAVRDPAAPETFFTQVETRQGTERIWKIERKGDMGTVSWGLLYTTDRATKRSQPTMKAICSDPADAEWLAGLTVEETFERVD